MCVCIYNTIYLGVRQAPDGTALVANVRRTAYFGGL